MTIPPHRAPGDLGHIGDHNDVSDVLTVLESAVEDVDSTVDAHIAAPDPHGAKAYADSTKAAIGHTHNYPVTSVNGSTGVVVLTPAGIGAETPAGAQAKVDALGEDIILQDEKGAPDGVAQLDEDGKVLSSQLPAGSGVLSVNGEAGNVVLDATDVGALATAARGAASGVASLDGSTLVPVAQIPGLDGNKITAGTVAIARIPTGSTGSTVSLGNHTHSYPVASVNSQTGTVVLAAADVGALATSARGAVSGVASLDGSSLVPVAQIPDLNASKITAGTLNSGRIPDLSASYITTGPNNNPQITSNATTRGWGRVDLNYTATGGTPDTLAFYYGGSGGSGGTRTGYHNEYGELRARPAQISTVALRAMGHTSGSSAAIFQVTNHDMTVTRAEVTETSATFNVPLTVNGAVRGTNLPAKIESGDTLPNPATYTDGDVFLLIP